MTETQKHFHDFLSANNILCNVKCADRDELLRLMLSMLKRHHPGIDLELAAREVKEREELFPTVIHDGVLPRKTFSMGEAHDKRFYLEARKIR